MKEIPAPGGVWRTYGLESQSLFDFLVRQSHSSRDYGFAIFVAVVVQLALFPVERLTEGMVDNVVG